MTVRLAAHADIPAMLALLEQVGRVHHDIRPDLFRGDARKYDAAALAALLEDPNRPIFIGEVDGFVAGYAFCIFQEIRNDPVLQSRKELYLDDLCVDEAHRGKGIATVLYRHVRAFAREAGCQAVTLNVWCGNEAALAFYEKCGMKKRKIVMEMPLEDSQC